MTILDGEALLLRDNARLALAEGVRLQADDILEVPDKARLLRIEFADGLSLALGPGTRAQLAPRLPGERGRARLYLLHGWAKISVGKGAAAGLASPLFDASGISADAVFALLPEGGQVFAETGELSLRPSQPGSPALLLKPGAASVLLAPSAKPVQTARPAGAFLQQVPRPFLDALPLRAALFQGKEREPKRLADITYADAQPWIDAEPMLRRAAVTRWRALARNPDFKRGLLADMKAHPEWEPVLFPPPPPAPKSSSSPSPAAASAPRY